jgi:hypothetical protein
MLTVTTVYYVRVRLSDGRRLYKIGVTGKDRLKGRFSANDMKLITLVAKWRYEREDIAYFHERHVLAQHGMHAYRGPAVLDCGNTELFTHDVLDLD